MATVRFTAVRQIMAWLNGRSGAIMAVLVVWVILTAAAAGGAAESDAWIGMPSMDWVTYVMVAMMVIAALLVLIAIVLVQKQGIQGTARRRPIWPMLLLMLLLVALSQRSRNPDEASPDPAAVPVDQPDPTAGDGAPRRPALGPTDLVALLLMTGGAVAVLLWSRRVGQTPGPGDDAGGLEAGLSPAVERATDQLLMGTDPRSAVLLAYRGLEDALEQLGRPRSSTETPAEHLRRVLRTLTIDPDPLVQLAELYQVARFSGHPITAAQQRRAAEWLQRARADLAAPA